MTTNDLNLKEMRQKIEEQYFRYQRAVTAKMGTNQEKERLKTVLFNNVNNIVLAIKMAEDSAKEIEVLGAHLDAADEELKELDEELKALKGKAPAKTGKKTKAEPETEPAPVDVDGE